MSEYCLPDLKVPYTCAVIFLQCQQRGCEARSGFRTFKQPTRRTDYPNLFCYKTLHISGIFSAHHQEFSTVHSALVSFMQVFGARFQAESGWNAVTKNLHETYQCRMYSRKLLMMGREDARNK